MSARPLLVAGGRGPSPLDRLDPRTRVLAAAAFALAVVLAGGLAAPAGAVAVAVVLAGLARLDARRTLGRMLALEGFMLLALALLPFTTPGAPVADLAGLPVSAEGLRRAAGIMLKANAVVLATLALAGAMEVVELGHALARLGAPQRFVALFLFTVRYIEVLDREYRRLRLAMRARAFRMRAGLHCWRSIGMLFGMLMVTSAERAERIHAAMRLRGFDGRFHIADDRRPGPLDWGFGAAHCLALLALAAVDRA